MSAPTGADQLRELADACAAALRDQAFTSALDEGAALLVATLKAGGKVLCCGNGGSAADAAHLAEELSGRYRGDRPALAAINLAGDAAAITCIVNDYGYEAVFSRQVEALGRGGDLLVSFSTSGKSANVLRAMEAARRLGLRNLAVLGKGGGPARELADVAVVVPHDNTARIQELHTLALHAFCEAAEHAFPPRA